MTGIELREHLSNGGVSIKNLAEQLCMTQPNLSAQFKVQDVKTGILEKICDVLGVTMDFFYGGTKYMKDDSLLNEKSNKLYADSKPDKQTADDKDLIIKQLEGKLQFAKEVIQMLGNGKSSFEIPVTLQKKNA